ncbi:RNA polymerase sigma factor [Paraburkholderia hospita]|uniref:RNA polymerase sigma factor n=1 Tax=Paraburkholderia hospita TaxID=169430 RepID=UPI0010563093|nr:sigma factor-like helix-turn-helix DNA-binding protein [Paraburkholderia hospita]
MTPTNKDLAHSNLLREVWNFALRLTCNPQLAEELVATTYLTAARSNICLIKSKAPRIVMLSVASNVWLKHRDSQRRFLDGLRLKQRSVIEDSRFSISSLNSLPEKERIAVILVDGHRLTFEDASWVLDVNTDTLKSWLLRAYSSPLLLS